MSKVKARICGQVEGEVWKLPLRRAAIDEAAPSDAPSPVVVHQAHRPADPPPAQPHPAQPHPAQPHPDWENARPPVAQLPGGAAQLIGERMRAMYGRLVQEAVPDALLDLIRELEDKEQSE